MPPDGSTYPNPTGTTIPTGTTGLPAGSDPSIPTSPPPQTPVAPGDDGISKGFHAFFDNIDKSIGDISAKMSAAFGAGQAVAQNAAQVSQQQSQAILAASQAGAQVVNNDAVQSAKRDATVAQEAIKAQLIGPEFDKTLAASAQQANEARDLIAQRNKADAVSFWSDPIQHIFNQIVTVPNLNTQIQDRVEGLSAIQAGIESRVKQLDAGAAASAAVNSVNTTARAAALTQQAVQKGIADSIDPMFKQAQIQLGAINAQSEALKGSVQALSEQANLPLKEQQNEYYGEVKQASILARNDAAKVSVLKSQEIQQSLTDRQSTLNDINFGRATLGLQPVPTLEELPKDLQAQFLKIGALTKNGGGLGYDPLDALNTFRTLVNKGALNPANLPGGQAIAFKNIQDAEYAARTQLSAPSATSPGLKGKDLEAALPGAIAQIYKNRSSVLHDDPSQRDLLFSPAPLDVLMKQDFAKGNPVLSALAPLTVDGKGNPIQNVPTSYQTILGTAAELVRGGKLSSAQASDAVTSIAKGAFDTNDKTYGYRRSGLADVIDTSKYNVMLPKVGGLFGGKSVVNLYSNAEVLRYLNTLIRNKETSESSANFLNK